MCIEGFGTAGDALRTRLIYVARTELKDGQKWMEEVNPKKPKLTFEDFGISQTDTLVAFFCILATEEDPSKTNAQAVKRDMTTIAKMCSIDLTKVSDLIDSHYALKLDEDEKKRIE